MALQSRARTYGNVHAHAPRRTRQGAARRHGALRRSHQRRDHQRRPPLPEGQLLLRLRHGRTGRCYLRPNDSTSHVTEGIRQG